MIYRSTPRAESPSHQQLYKAHTESTPRCTSSVTPTRNSFSLSMIPRAQSPHSSSRLMSTSANGVRSKSRRLEDTVYVADVNPTYSVAAAVRCIAPVNDRVMWTAEYSGTLCIRSLPKGTPLKELPGREGSYCISLLYLPSEDVVWAGFQDGYLHVYSAKNTDLLKEMMAHGGGLNCMIEVEGSVFTGGGNWKLCQWDPTDCNAQLQRSLHGHSGGVRCLVLYNGPTGAVIFSGSDDGTVRAWDPYESLPGQENTEANIHTFTGHSRAVLALAVVPHASQLWSAGEDLTLRVWDMRSLSCLAVCRGNHTAPISNLMVVESRVWSADKHGHILIWDIATRSLLQDLSERVPYYGLEKGMVLAMQKVQPTTAYKVWTASSNGVLQCWNAETVPIIFDDVPVFGSVFKAPSAGPAAPQVITAGIGRSASATPAVGTSADVVCSSAVTLASSNNYRDTLSSSHSKDNLPVSAPTTQVQEYIRSLQDELEATKRDAKLNYEKYRMEAQCEIETQQLLAQENDRLRGLVQELEKRAGEPPEGLDAPVQVPQGAASHHMMEEEVARLQSVLIDTQRQLDEALERQLELEAELDRYKPASSSLHMSSMAISPKSAAPDPYRQFMRQDGMAKLPSTVDDACSDSHFSSVSPSGPVNTSTNPLNAFLFMSCQDDGESASHSGVPVEHTRLSRRFKGGNWSYIMEEKPHELRSTFIADFCAGVGVAPTQLERVDLSLGSLVAEVEVVHPANVPSAELERRMQTYRFPALMRLHTDAFTAAKTPPDTAVATINDLQRQLAMAQEQRRVQPSPEPQQPSSNDNSCHSEGRISASEWQRLKDQNNTLRDTLQRQIKLINDLKNESAEKDVKLADARAHLQDAEKRLQEAQEQQQDRTPRASRQRALNSTGAYTENYGRDPPHVDGTARKEASEFERMGELVAVPLAQEMVAAAGRARLPPTAVGAGDDEDHEALKRYLHEQLKPMVSRLKREQGELQLDNGNMKKRIEELTAQVQQQQKQLESERQKKAPVSPVVASEASDEEVQKLREDHEALNNYLHEQLKPTISRLKREKGELQLDLSRSREDLQRACDMYDGAAAALEEEHVREEKMGEAMEALRKALEAEQLKNQTSREEAAAAAASNDSHAASSATCQGFEILTGRPTQPTQLRSCGGSAEPRKEDAEKDPLDKLVALNLDLSVRLADAETVIAQLQNSLACSSSQMAEQRDETRRLLSKIQQYQQSGTRSPDSSGAGRCSSIDNVVSSASPSKSPSQNRQ
ncbi:WD domain G-beta repeat [Leishmania donovani]|uniref:WD_domain_G-beta_repeat_putative/Pfam:PF00400 n=1 Tax=Leishmania donovani TaxID=5661 RepID=A0A6J8F9T3_LEIDO|nr:WD domain G-beta repeat [Leishmania donovani]VDZ44499.1 WD_domain_G-beta_repeat_putative/Pfam:PF00400 [Leishmania donovani]